MDSQKRLPTQILRDTTFEEDSKESDELALACTNIFNSTLSDNENIDIEKALTTLQHLQKEMPINVIRSQIKKQIIDDLNALQTQPSIDFPYFIYRIFEIPLEDNHPLKETLDLYQELLQEVIEEHILHQTEVTFTHYPVLKTSLTAYCTDFFNKLRVSPLEDNEKNRILIEILQGFRLNDYSKILDLRIDFGFKELTKENKEHNDKIRKKWREWNHLDSTLSRMQRLLRKFHRDSLDKHILLEENEIFYKEVTYWKLLKSCELHLNYLYDIIKFEIKEISGNDTHNFYQYYFADKSASKVKILQRILTDYIEDSKAEVKTGLAVSLPEKIFQALESFQKVFTFYGSLRTDPSFTNKTIDAHKSKIEELKKDLENIGGQGNIIPENKFFTDILQITNSAKFKPESNYLYALVDKALSLNILQQQKMKKSVKIATSWPEADEPKLNDILQNMQGKQLTVQTFMQALIENETKGKERVRISNQCIHDFVEYLGFMEEISHFQTKLAQLSNANKETVKLMMTHELAKMPAAKLNRMLQKIKPYCTLATQYSNTLESSMLTTAKGMLKSIAECIEKINAKRIAEGGINPLGQVIPDTIRLRQGLRYAFKYEKVKTEDNKSVFVLGEQKNRDAVFTMSRLSYIPKPSHLDDQKTTLNRLKTINALKTSCEIFNTHLKNRIVSLLPKEINNQLAGSLEFTRKLDNYLDDASSYTRLISQVLNVFHQNQQPITGLIKSVAGLENALVCYEKELSQLHACLEDESISPYEKLLSFEAKLSQCKSIFEQENTPAAQKFLASIQEKQDSDIVLHHACNVFEKEMREKVDNILLNESNKSDENKKLYQSYGKLKDKDTRIHRVLKSYHATQPTPEEKALKKLLTKNEELAVSLQKYEIAADMKHHLSYYRKRPQIAIDIFKRKLKKHTATLKKHEDGPVTKFFQAIARAFGYVPKQNPTEAFYATAKNILFAAGANSTLIKEANDLQKETKHYKRI